MIPRFAWSCTVFAVAITAAPAHAAQGDVHEHVLANGMKIVVMEDHRAPTVASMVWYKAGSMDELSGTTGVAHVLEHMMFKGTKGNAPDMFARTIAAAGGRDNAFTNRDYTAYFQQLHKSKLPLAMRLEADRMRNLTLSEKEFEKEIKVVMEERRWRTEDKPRSLVYEQLMAVAFLAHPYRWPVIGWMNDLESMTIQDLRQWYHRWYAPNNATLVVVGDVKPEQVFKLAQRYYGKYKPIALPVRKPQDEPLQQGIRRVTVKAPAKLPYLIMGYRVVPLRDARNDWEPYALEVLAGVLDGHPAARLNRELVREARIAQSVGTGYDLLARGPSIFLLEGTPSEGRTVAELEAALREQVRRIVDEGVGEEELNRVKAQVVANQVYSRDSMFYQAMQIGQLEMVGLSYKDLDVLIQKLQAVTADQVREVAKKYLVEDRLTVAVLDPQPLDEARPALPPKGMRHAQ